MGETKGWEEEFDLESGDVSHYAWVTEKGRGCQEVYKHSLIPTKTKINPRINLTFRQFE